MQTDKGIADQIFPDGQNSSCKLPVISNSMGRTACIRIRQEEDVFGSLGSPYSVLDVPSCAEGCRSCLSSNEDHTEKGYWPTSYDPIHEMGRNSPHGIFSTTPPPRTSQGLVRGLSMDSATWVRQIPILAKGPDFLVWDRRKLVVAETCARKYTTGQNPDADENECASAGFLTEVEEGTERIAILKDAGGWEEKVGYSEELSCGDEEGSLDGGEHEGWEGEHSSPQQSWSERALVQWSCGDMPEDLVHKVSRTESWPAGTTESGGPHTDQRLRRCSTWASELKELCSPERMDAARSRVQDAARHLIEAQERANHLQLQTAPRPPLAPRAARSSSAPSSLWERVFGASSPGTDVLKPLKLLVSSQNQ